MAQHDQTITRSIRFSAPLLKALDDEAKQRGISTQKLIEIKLEQAYQTPPDNGEPIPAVAAPEPTSETKLTDRLMSVIEALANSKIKPCFI